MSYFLMSNTLQNAVSSNTKLESHFQCHLTSGIVPKDLILYKDSIRWVSITKIDDPTNAKAVGNVTQFILIIVCNNQIP